MKTPVDIHNLSCEKTTLLKRTFHNLRSQLTRPYIQPWEKTIIRDYMSEIEEELKRRANK